MTHTRKNTTLIMMLGVSTLALGTNAQAHDVLFSTSGQVEKGEKLENGKRISQTGGVTQIKLDHGAMASFVEAADYALREDGSIDLYEGTVTISGADGTPTVVHMPDGVTGEVAGLTSAASFTASGANGGRREKSFGHVLNGKASIGAVGRMRMFQAGQMWRSEDDGNVEMVIANSAQPVPDQDMAANSGQYSAAVPVEPLKQGGPLAAAKNGLPVSLGEALAANGASGDILAAAKSVETAIANPAIANFPRGDFATLAAFAAQFSSPLGGGQAFDGANADIIRTYFAYLANGGNQPDFISVYAGLTLQYLDLIRSGAMPSSFEGASAEQINAFLAFRGNRGVLASLNVQDRALADAYLAFIRDGGNSDLFASRYTDVINAYFAFLRNGGDPVQFAGASQQTVNEYLVFLRDSGLSAQLSSANRALLAIYLGGLANGGNGFAFASQYQTALNAYFEFLAAGNLPSEYTGIDPDTLEQYLLVLSQTGLSENVLGQRAGFYADYLAFLQTGGDPDAFAGLPANIFAGYAGELAIFNAFLSNGGLPSEYSGDVALLRTYLQRLSDAGALNRFLGSDAAFFANYLAFLEQGGTIDAFPGLNVNIFTGYATELNAFNLYLAAGGVPSDYSEADIADLQAYLEILANAGALNRFLGSDAAFFTQYLAFLKTGGDVDGFAGLNANIFAGYAVQLDAYYQYLLNGGIPSAYTDLTQAQIRQYLAALSNAGADARFLGNLAQFYNSYFVFLNGGGNPDLFAGLPTPPDFDAFASAVNAYFIFLQSGGLPGDYTALDITTLQQYITALIDAGQLDQRFGADAAFLRSYFAFLDNGGDPALFADLPVYTEYTTALQAYYAFLAGGGLPTDYTALTQAQIAAYIAALQNAGGLSVRFDSDISIFLGNYFAFVNAGGNPANFAGLPIYTQYTSALQAYYIFLLDGGLPSEYTLLTQAQIAAYIDALRAAGGLSGRFDVNIATFLGNYADFISGGGTPDQFAGLPDMGGPGTGQLTGYEGGFDSPTAKFGFVVGGGLRGRPFAGSETGATVSGYQLDANGGLTVTGGAGRSNRTNGTASITDIFGNENALIGRWTDGVNTGGNPFQYSANQGLHYLLSRPISETFTLPTSGQINYDLIASTRPTIADGSLQPGVFDAKMALVFGSDVRVALEGDITMPRDGGDYVFTFTTPGGVDDADQSNVTLSLNGENANFFVPGDNSDGNCNGQCRIRFFTSFTGDDTDIVGALYQTFQPNSLYTLSGAAIFASSGNGNASPPPPPPSVSVDNPGDFAAQTGYGSFFVYARDGGPSLLYSQGGNANYTSLSYDDTDQSLKNFSFCSFAGLCGPITVQRFNAENFENFGNEDIVIGRWSGASYAQGRRLNSLSDNQGLHYVAISTRGPDFMLPTTGRIDYDLLAATSPTVADGSFAPGTFDGKMAVLFGSDIKIGMEATATFAESSAGAGDGYSWTFSNDGGLGNEAGFADAGISGVRVNAAVNAVSSNDHCASTCTVDLIASFAGKAGETLGLNYRTDGAIANKNVIGAAIFGKAEQTAMASRFSDMAVASQQAPTSASPDWNRWSGNPEDKGSGGNTGTTALKALADKMAEGNKTASLGAAKENPRTILNGNITFNDIP